jgi:hypothetical protein
LAKEHKVNSNSSKSAHAIPYFKAISILQTLAPPFYHIKAKKQWFCGHIGTAEPFFAVSFRREIGL